MATKIYYRAGKPDKNVDPTGGKVGHIQAIEEYIAKDETRVVFEKRLKEEESFRKMLGFTKHTVEEYLHEWRERAKTGGQFVQPADHVNEKGVHDGLMCTNLYELGTWCLEFENITSFSRVYYVAQITRISLTSLIHTTRKNQRSNLRLIMMKTRTPTLEHRYAREFGRRRKVYGGND